MFEKKKVWHIMIPILSVLSITLSACQPVLPAGSHPATAAQGTVTTSNLATVRSSQDVHVPTTEEQVRTTASQPAHATTTSAKPSPIPSRRVGVTNAPNQLSPYIQDPIGYVKQRQANPQRNTIPIYDENELFHANGISLSAGWDCGWNRLINTNFDILGVILTTFPDPKVHTSEQHLYLIYETEQQTRLFLFFDPAMEFEYVGGYPVLMKKALERKQFAGIKEGSTIEEVGAIDPVIPIYLKNFKRANQQTFFFGDFIYRSVHLLRDGLLVYQYRRTADDQFIVEQITFSPEFQFTGYRGSQNYRIDPADYIS